MMFSKKRPTCGAVIVAAGSGSRMKLDSIKGLKGVNKVFLSLADMPVIVHTLLAFEKSRLVDGIVIVTRECDIAQCAKIVQEFSIKKIISIVKGGESRSQSVMAGLGELRGKYDYVAVHDGARCLVSSKKIDEVIGAAFEYGAASLGIRCTDSLKKADAEGFIQSAVERENVVRIQTPQVFKTEQIIAAHEKAAEAGYEVTDDCGAAEYGGIRVKIVEGEEFNIKLTTQSDFELIKTIIEK